MAKKQDTHTLSAEQTADLDDLDAIAAKVEPSVTVTEQAAPECPAPVPSEQIIGSVLGLVPIGLELAGLKKTAAIWTPEACHGTADKLVPVLRKYAIGRKVLEVLESGGGIEELALAIYIGPLVMATINSARSELAEQQAAPAGAVTDEAAQVASA